MKKRFFLLFVISSLICVLSGCQLGNPLDAVQKIKDEYLIAKEYGITPVPIQENSGDTEGTKGTPTPRPTKALATATNTPMPTLTHTPAPVQEDTIPYEELVNGETDAKKFVLKDEDVWTNAGCNFRKSNSAKSEKIGSFKAGVKLHRLGVVGDWSRVEYNGTIGYIGNDYLTLTAPDTTKPTAAPTNTPTVKPTTKPTNTPTAKPTAVPTKAASQTSSKVPQSSYPEIQALLNQAEQYSNRRITEKILAETETANSVEDAIKILHTLSGEKQYATIFYKSVDYILPLGDIIESYPWLNYLEYENYINGVPCNYTSDGILITYSVYGGYINDDALLLYALLYKDSSVLKGENLQCYKKIAEICESKGWNGQTDFEKIKDVHDYIITNTAYDWHEVYGGELHGEERTYSYEVSSSVYGTLFNGYAICGGYTKTFDAFMAYLGIPSFYVFGTANGDSHAWNQVMLEGEWYNIDLTWDDPLIGNKTLGHNADYPNNISYKYFLFADDYSEADRTLHEECYAKECTDLYGRDLLIEEFFVNEDSDFETVLRKQANQKWITLCISIGDENYTLDDVVQALKTYLGIDCKTYFHYEIDDFMFYAVANE